MFELFKNRNFLLLWLGRIVSKLGDGITTIALSLWFINATGSPKLTGIYVVISLVSKLAVLPIIGVVVDRFSRKKIIVYCDFLRGVILVFLAFVIKSDAIQMSTQIGIIYVSTVFISILSILFTTAINSATPNIIDKDMLKKSSGLIFSTNNIINIVAIVFGATLVAFFGFPICLLIDGITFIISGISEIFIKFPKFVKQAQERVGYFTGFKQGLDYVKSYKLLLNLIVFFFIINFFLAPLNLVVFPFMIKSNFGDQGIFIFNKQYTSENIIILYQSTISIIMGLGGIITGIIKLLEKSKTDSLLKIPYFAIGIGTCTLLIGLVYLPSNVMSINHFIIYSMFCGIFFIRTIFSTMVNINIGLFMQQNVENEYRGRVMSVLSFVAQASMPLGILITTLFIDYIDQLNVIFIFSGVLVMLSSLKLIAKVKNENKKVPEFSE